MSKFADLLGTIANTFQIGLRGAGLRRLRFRNEFNGDLEWTPTANRVLTLPDLTGVVLTGSDSFISTFELVGSNMVAVPAWTNTVILEGWSGGSGGAGGGKRGAGVAVTGGGGGAGGNYAYRIFTRSELAQFLSDYNQIQVLCGGGGSGGAGAIANDSNGLIGNPGGTTLFRVSNGSTFVDILWIFGPGNGFGSTNAIGGSAATANGSSNNLNYQGNYGGGSGGSSSATAPGGTAEDTLLAGCGGGAGGGIDNSNVARIGGTGGRGTRLVASSLSLTVGTSGGIGTNGGAGNTPGLASPYSGTGGGGGGGSITGNGGNGGSGGRACGGGGGGAARNGVGNGGTGGTGGAGYARVIFLR